MDWSEVNDKTKKKINRNFVSFAEKREMEYLKVIKEEFPYLSESKVNQVIEECCKEIPAPKPRSNFLKY